MCWHLYVVWYPASTNTVEVGDMQLKYVLNKPVLGRLGFCKSRSWCPFVPWNMTAEDNLNISFNFWHNFMHLFVNLYVSKILEKVRKNYLKSGHFQIVVCLFVLSILWRISVRYGQWRLYLTKLKSEQNYVISPVILTVQTRQTIFWNWQENLVVIVSSIIHVKLGWRLNVTNKFKVLWRLSKVVMSLSCFMGHPVHCLFMMLCFFLNRTITTH